MRRFIPDDRPRRDLVCTRCDGKGWYRPRPRLPDRGFAPEGYWSEAMREFTALQAEWCMEGARRERVARHDNGEVLTPAMALNRGLERAAEECDRAEQSAINRAASIRALKDQP